MSGSSAIRAAAFAAALTAATSSLAQQQQPPQPAAEREKIEIGLSTNRISIRSDFSGADLTIFGALDNADPFVRRQSRYDIVVILVGPGQSFTVRRKSRVLGMWMNTDSRTFGDVPSSYSLSSTRALRDLTDEKTLSLLNLGVNNLETPPADGGYDSDMDAQFALALRTLKSDRRLFNERIGDVEFLSANLFRATLSLPATVPIGVHRARAYLFKNGQFVTETSAQLEIRKAGLEQAIYDQAHGNGFVYGLFAVFTAMLTGWLGRLVFQRD